MGNKDAGSGPKGGCQVAGAPRLTNNPRKIKTGLRTKVGLAMNQLLQQWGWNQQRWSRRCKPGVMEGLGGDGIIPSLSHSSQVLSHSSRKGGTSPGAPAQLHQEC